MIDVHILLMGDENKQLLDECLASLADEPVKIHFTKGIDGHPGKARTRAVSLGTNEYVGWVDPDDYIIPGSYSKLLKTGAPFAWTDELIYDLRSNDLYKPIRQRISSIPHHMHIIHRDILDTQLLSNNVRGDVIPFLKKMAQNNSVHIPEVGYVWRNYFSPSQQQRLRQHVIQSNSF